MTYKIRGILIDPGDFCELFENVEGVLLTHAHFDHIYGLNEVIRFNPGVRIYTNDYGKGLLLDAKKNLSRYHDSEFIIADSSSIVIVQNNQDIRITEEITATPIFTPGHNPSCITWKIQDMLFTGDTFIPGVKTVTNLPGGNRRLAEESIALIKELSKTHTLYPGHKIKL